MNPPTDPAEPSPPPPHRRKRLMLAALILLCVGALAPAMYRVAIEPAMKSGTVWQEKAKLAPSGGRYFFRRMEIPVPSFRQADPRWARDEIGGSKETLAAVGCAVASAAMVLASYGFDTDPQRLNQFLIEHDGYTPQGWLKWEAAAELSSGRVRHAYEDLPSYALLDENLSSGNPVIVRIRNRAGVTHFVVLAGKDGYDYLTRDPGAGADKGLYPLREYGSDIEALRFYERSKE